MSCNTTWSGGSDRATTASGPAVRRLLVALFLALGVAWLPGAASATPFTLSSPVAISGTISGSINPVTDLTGSLLHSVGSTGYPGFGSVDVFVFDVTITSGAMDQIGLSIGASFSEPLGAGSFDDTGSGDQGTSSVPADFFGVQLFNFTPNTVSGETSVRLFASYTAGYLSIGQSVTFMVSPVSGADFSVFGTAIPEPGTLSLMGLGLAVLAVLGRRRRTVT
jgi:hypothetical protein